MPIMRHHDHNQTHIRRMYVKQREDLNKVTKLEQDKDQIQTTKPTLLNSLKQ